MICSAIVKITARDSGLISVRLNIWLWRLAARVQRHSSHTSSFGIESVFQAPISAQLSIINPETAVYGAVIGDLFSLVKIIMFR